MGSPPLQQAPLNHVTLPFCAIMIVTTAMECHLPFLHSSNLAGCGFGPQQSSSSPPLYLSCGSRHSFGATSVLSPKNTG